MKAVPVLTSEVPATTVSPSREQDLPNGSSSFRHATGGGGVIPSNLRNMTTHSSFWSLTQRATIGSARVLVSPHEEPALAALLVSSLDASCKNSIHDYAQQQPCCNTPHHHHFDNNRHGSLDRGLETSRSGILAAIRVDEYTRRKKRHSLPTTTTSFASVTATTNTIPPTTPSPPLPLPVHTTLSATPMPSSSSLQPRTTNTITITATHEDRIIRSTTTPPKNTSETARTPSPMPHSGNNSVHHTHRSMDVTGVNALSMGNGAGGGAGGGGGSNGVHLSISTQHQRSSTGRDSASPNTLTGLGGSSTINNSSSVSSGSSAIGLNENATWPGHARPAAGGSGVGGQWKPNTLSSSSTSATLPLSRKYEPVSKGIDHSEVLAMPSIYFGNLTQQQQPQQQQQHQIRSGPVHGSEPQQQCGRQSQPTFSTTATATISTTGPTFHQQNSSININNNNNTNSNNNSTEMETFSESHSGVIMAYPNNLSSSSSHTANTTPNRPRFIGRSDFVRSLFSQSLVSRLYSHRPRFSSVSVGTSTWSVMRVFNTCHLLYLIPVTSISIAQLVTIDMICNEQLYSWLTVQAFLFLSQIVSTCNILQRQTTMMISSSRANVMDQRTRVMLMVSMIWTVIGVGFLGSESASSQDPCATMNDPIYTLSLRIIIFHATMIGFYFLPCSSLLLTRVLPNSITSGQTRTATKPMIDKLGSTPMVEGMFGGDAEEATCAICLGDYKPGETIRFLPCQHHFHLECVDQWLATDKSCPLCKHDIDKPLEIHNSRRSVTPHLCNNNTSEDETHHNHNNSGPSHNSNSSSGNNVVGMEGFQVIIA